MDQSQYVPRNRVAEHVERMNARKTETKKASLDDEVRRQNFADHVNELFAAEKAAGRTTNDLAKDSGVPLTTLLRWAKIGTIRDQGGIVTKLCGARRIIVESMWEDTLRYVPETQAAMLAEAWADVSDFLKTNPPPDSLRLLRLMLSKLRG